MNSFILVLLALIAGAAAGSGILVAMRPDIVPPRPAKEPASDASGKPDTPGTRAGPATDSGAKPDVSKEYLRLAQALLVIDERITAMEASQEAAMDSQRKLVDEIREMAMQLEIRSGQMKPMREPGQPLQPVRTLPDARAITPGIRPVPTAPPACVVPRGKDASGDPLPEW